MQSSDFNDSPLKAVVFDFDGLMFNTEALYQEVGHEVLGRRGKTLTDDLLDQLMGRKAHDSLQLMIDYHGLDDTPEELAVESMEVMFGLLEGRLAPMPGLIKLLESLEAANIPKGIATSSSRMFVTHVLSLFEMEPRFKFVLTQEDVMNGKPEPEVYLLAAVKHGIPPAEILVLEDSLLGSRAAVSAGNYTVAVPHGHSHTHQFEGVKFIADSLEDQRIYQALGI